MIINHMTDTDLYKITMGQVVFNQYPYIGAEYELINRGQTVFPMGFADALQREVNDMGEIMWSHEEKKFLSQLHILKPTYLEWLTRYHFDPGEVLISQVGGDLSVVIKGPWYRTIYWEVPLMAIVSELYFQMMGSFPNPAYYDVAWVKGRFLSSIGAPFIDFGTRRRFSFDVHDRIIQCMVGSGDNGFLGTSNVYLAMKYNTKPVGTHAHEWFQAHAAMFGYRMATTSALGAWVKEYNGELGIALSDTFTTDEFLSRFNAFYARLFDDVRQDSGDPLIILEKVIAHYQGLGINPTTKTIVFSDHLNIETIERIMNALNCRIRPLFGIGTNLTNDVGVTPLNFVIKLFRVILPDSQVVPVVKLSDDVGKISGDQRALQAAYSELGIDRGT